VWSQKEILDADTVCVGDLGVTWQEREQRMAELVGWFGTLGEAVMAHLIASHQGARGDGSSLVYLFETPEGSLLYQDTSGHWTGILRDLRPDVAILAAAGRGNVDGEPVQGTLAQFIARQAALLQPKRVVLCHHDDWLPGFSIATNVAPIRETGAVARWAPTRSRDSSPRFAASNRRLYATVCTYTDSIPQASNVRPCNPCGNSSRASTPPFAARNRQSNSAADVAHSC
jgi:hypothetical protein